MNSAVGNFNSSGERLNSTQTPENKVFDPVGDINWCKSKIMSLEDTIKALEKNNIPVVTEENIVLEVTDYGVTKQEWDTFSSLCIAMIANGASLYELQQRLMGFSVE